MQTVEYVVTCHFCKRKCVPYTDFTVPSGSVFNRYRCHHHQTVVTYMVASKILTNANADIAYGFGYWTRYQSKLLLVAYYKLWNGGELFELEDRTAGNNKIEILKWDHFPKHINPDNIDSKIATLILFS